MLLPAVIVLAWFLRETSLREMRGVEGRAMDAADILLLLSDARAESDIAGLRVLSTSRIFAENNISAAAERARDAIRLVPGWNAIVLTDRSNGDTIFEATSTGTVMTAVGIANPRESKGATLFGGVDREGTFCPCVTLYAKVRNAENLELTLYVDPQVYQNLLRARFPEGAIAAIVDKEGDFLARSVDYAQRVGTPGTSFVLEAVARGGSGIYKGVTYEGLTNYTAYVTSSLTGWSAHVAINNALIDRPRSRATSAVIFGALIAILIGSGLFTYVIKDLATRRMEDKRLMELQKAEAMAQFTATIVHDFRNILTAMQSGSRMILRTTTEPQVKTYAELIEGAVQRGTKLSNRLLSFARENDAEIEAIPLGAFFDDLEYLLKQAAGRSVEVIIERPSDSIIVSANRDQLELAMINLTINARDAMNGSGRVEIATKIDGNCAAISVSDNGPGIPLAVKHELFKPFFTTKPNGSGTGLGLAQVAGMARQAGGEVSIDNAPGGGAQILLRLPISPTEA